MKLTFAAATIALFSTVLAVPANGVNDSLQKQIQALEITIVNVINDIVQSNPNLKNDYTTGLNQLRPLVNGLQGPQYCSTFGYPYVTDRNTAIQYLQNTNLALQQTSLDLLDPNKKIANGDLHNDICAAGAYYVAVSKFAGV